jgi:hypothetical protein
MLFTIALSVLLQVVLVTRGAFAVEGAIRIDWLRIDWLRLCCCR